MIKRALVGVALVLGSLANAQPVTSAFTFQGELRDGGAPANGAYDLRFRLFDAAAGGAQVGPTLCSDNVAIADGRYTTTLDFGQQYASGSLRHLEVQVRLDSGLGCADATGFTTLSPRQQLTAAPLATQAQSAFSLSAPGGSPQNAVFVDSSGLVGIGTTSPQAGLHIVTPPSGEGVRIQGLSPTASNVSYLSFYNSAGTEIGYVGDGSTGDNSIYLTAVSGDVHLYTATGAALTATSAGDVGVGATIPLSKLDVRGDIRLGTSGQFFAVKSESPDRTLRGTVNTNGSIGAGSGFSISHTVAGIYVINFDVAFATPPTVVASSIAQARKIHVIQSQTTFASIGSTDVSNTFIDGGFTFIAMGN